MSKFNEILIEGARTNNLKNIDLRIPLNKITCIYGPSGSGKSSLVFGTLVDESKRRFINSLPNDIKFLWNIPASADVDKIEPVLPVWALSQINPVVGSRPVVSDLLGVTELLTRHFSLNGDFHCSECGGEIVKKSFSDFLIKWSSKFDSNDVIHFLVEKNIYGSIAPIATPVRSASSERGSIKEFVEDDKYWEVNRTRVKFLGKGIKIIEEFVRGTKPKILIKVTNSKKYTSFQDMGYFCSSCNVSIHSSDFSPEKFNPLIASGACSECDGFGQKLEYDLSKIVKNETLTLDEGAIPLLTYKQFAHLMDDFKRDLKKKKINPALPFGEMAKAKWKILEEGGDYFCGLVDIYSYFERKKYKRSIRILSRRLKTESICESCHGTRLGIGKLELSLKGVNLADALKETIEVVIKKLKGSKTSKDLSFEKLSYILKTATELGLSQITLNRKVKALSSGEYQRLLLTKILAQQGTGMLFVFDEPSRGLSYREQKILIEKIDNLKEQGNTVVIVDHSEYIQETSDFLIKMGPGAGSQGGVIVSQKKNRKKQKILKDLAFPLMKNPKSYIEFLGVEILRKKLKRIKFPLNCVNWVTGDSGTGKTLFFKYVLYSHLEWKHTGVKSFELDYNFTKFHATNVITKVNYFDPELRTASSRSTVGTFLGFSELVRKHYSRLPVSIKLGLEQGCFSPNSDLGKCLTCEGRGSLEIDMQFLENLTIKCEDCNGKKLKAEISSISDGRITVDEAYNLPLLEVLSYYKLTPKFSKLVEYTKLLKLSHLSLARTLKSLSGGERLRLQFLKNLNLKSVNEMFIFDNLSIGLSGNELEGICTIIEELRRKKNTIVVIDSNPYFSNIADNRIDFNRL